MLASEIGVSKEFATFFSVIITISTNFGAEALTEPLHSKNATSSSGPQKYDAIQRGALFHRTTESAEDFADAWPRDPDTHRSARRAHDDGPQLDPSRAHSPSPQAFTRADRDSLFRAGTTSERRQRTHRRKGRLLLHPCERPALGHLPGEEPFVTLDVFCPIRDDFVEKLEAKKHRAESRGRRGSSSRPTTRVTLRRIQSDPRQKEQLPPPGA